MNIITRIKTMNPFPLAIIAVAIVFALALLVPSKADADTQYEAVSRNHAIDGGITVNMGWRWANTVRTDDRPGMVKLKDLDFWVSGDRDTLAEAGLYGTFRLYGGDGNLKCDFAFTLYGADSYFRTFDNSVQNDCPGVFGPESEISFVYHLRDRTTVGGINDMGPYVMATPVIR